MKILVTGANGQLGNEMQAIAADNPQHEYFFTDVRELDICDEQAVHAFVRDRAIEVIVNCAAYTAVDKAEDNAELCDRLNREAPGYLADAAEALKAAGATDIYACATHPIFSGNAVEELKDSPYKEVVVTDTITIPEEKQFANLKVLSIAPVFAKAISLIYNNQSVDSLFRRDF